MMIAKYKIYHIYDFDNNDWQSRTFKLKHFEKT